MSFLTLRYFGHALIACVLSANAFATDYAGTGTGAIPDNTPAGINISFNTTGFNQAVGDIKLKLNIDHTWIGDIKMTLTSPGGIAQLVIFSRVGLSSTNQDIGSGADLAGLYVFSDLGRDLWDPDLPMAGKIPLGNYRTSTRGAELVNGSNDGGGCYTSLSGAFGGLSPFKSSGVWTLNVSDSFNGDIGTVNAATLSLSAQSDGIFRNGFEIASRGNCKLARLDFTGRGRSSYVLVRDTGNGMTWFIKDNDSAAGGADSNFVHGTNIDFFLQGDWDGDGLSDAAIWRPGATGLFIIRPSSHPTLLRTVAFGQANDDPTITDDFDGDGLTDFAVYRAALAPGITSKTLIKLNATGAERTVVTGVQGNYAASGDYNGDGVADVATQESAGATARYRLLDSVTGFQFYSFLQGDPNDFVVDGNFAGSFRDDITTVRGLGGVVQWTTTDGNGTLFSTVPFGVSANGFALTGDYDGDGLDDYSVWTHSAAAGASKFSIRPSSAPATPIDIPMGANNDYPVGNARTH